MAAKLVSRKNSPLTPEIAGEFAAMQALKNERGIKASRILGLAELIREERFFMPTWAVVNVRNFGKFRVNGQHTSKLLNCIALAGKGEDGFDPTIAEMAKITSDDPILFPGGDVSLDTWEADNMPDSFDAFAYYDATMSTRTNNDLLAVRAGEYDDLYGISGGQMEKVLKPFRAYADAEIKASRPVFGDTLVIPRVKDVALLLSYLSVRKYIVWCYDLPEEIRPFFAISAWGYWLSKRYDKSGGAKTAVLLDRIIEQDDEGIGPGHEMLDRMRKNKSRDQKTMPRDKLLRMFERKAAEIEE